MARGSKTLRFVKEECKDYGGVMTKDTGYESLFFGIVNDLLKKDVGVKNGLFAAMGAG